MRTQIISAGDLETARGRKTVKADSSTQDTKGLGVIRRHLLATGFALVTSRLLGVYAVVQLERAALAVAEIRLLRALAGTVDTADTIGASE